MIKLTEEIIINSKQHVIWSLITDFPKSFSCNRFHINLELPINYSLGKIKKFNIIHNFGFGNYKMVAEIIDFIPPSSLIISKYCQENKKRGFPHTIEFHIEQYMGKSKVYYTVKGTYGGKVQDLSFKPILKGVMIDELRKIKKTVESSEKNTTTVSMNTIKSI